MRNYKAKNDLNYLDRFLYKLLIGMFLVVILVVGERLKIISLKKIQNSLNENINILKVVKVFNGPNHTLIPLDEDNALEVINIDYTNYSLIDGGRKINLDDNEVKNIRVGIVVKIVKHDYYEIHIKSIDGMDYIYRDLEKIDVSIYQYVKTGQKIGKAYNNSFELFVMSKGELLSLDDVYPI